MPLQHWKVRPLSASATAPVVPTVYKLNRVILCRTFAIFRECGRGCRECQVLWTSSLDTPDIITCAIHSMHRASEDGNVLDEDWLSEFWFALSEKNMVLRVQVHTHPKLAFHSATDDRSPMVRAPGFLSLVIPNFGLGPIGFEGTYLAEIQADGSWQQTSIASRLTLID